MLFKPLSKVLAVSNTIAPCLPKANALAVILAVSKLLPILPSIEANLAVEAATPGIAPKPTVPADIAKSVVTDAAKAPAMKPKFLIILSPQKFPQPSEIKGMAFLRGFLVSNST